MKTIKNTLPEWSFLSENADESNGLADRRLILHFPSYTILEVIPVKGMKEFKFKGPVYQFQNTNKLGKTEKLLFYIHCTLSHNLDQILENSAIWYCNYLDREETNHLIDEKLKQN
jgi:hypothetical protein